MAMPADLTVIDVRVPSLLRSPCPIIVRVTVRNDGADPSDPGPWDVTIQLSAGESQAVSFETIVSGEGQYLAPGQMVTVPVTVRFPCWPLVTLQATADFQRQIANNLRTS